MAIIINESDGMSKEEYEKQQRKKKEAKKAKKNEADLEKESTPLPAETEKPPEEEKKEVAEKASDMMDRETERQLKALEEEITTELALVNSSSDIKDLVEKIYLYCEAQSGTSLYPYQSPFAKRIIKSVIVNDGEEITALFSRQSGKTESAAVALGGLMVILPILAKLMPENENLQQFKDGVLVGIFAPSKEQAHTAFTRLKSKLTSKNARMVMTDPEISVDFESEKGNPIVLTNGSLCRMMTAAKQSQIESKTYHIIWVDECQDVDDMKLLKSIHPMGASTNATLIKIGTPNTKKSSFYETVRRNIRKAQEYGAEQNHFQYDYRTVQKYNKRYAKYIEKEIERIGYDSDEFRMAYRLHFILERGMFITEDVLTDTYDNSLKLKESSAMPCGVGMDVGKGADSTVVTVVEMDWDNAYENALTGQMHPQKSVIAWLELEGDDHEVQFHKIIEFLKNYNVRTMYIDSTGKGDAVADRFIYALDMVDVVAYPFSRQSKSEMWKALDTELRQHRLTIPGHSRVKRTRQFKKFESQMLDLEKDYVGQYMVCQHPDTKGAHDDYCDSLGLANLAAQAEFYPEIEETDY